MPTTRKTKPVSNPNIEGCEDALHELEDITSGSVIFLTKEVKKMMTWAHSSIVINKQEMEKWFRNTDEHKAKRMIAQLKLHEDEIILARLQELLNVE